MEGIILLLLIVGLFTITWVDIITDKFPLAIPTNHQLKTEEADNSIEQTHAFLPPTLLSPSATLPAETITPEPTQTSTSIPLPPCPSPIKLPETDEFILYKINQKDSPLMYYDPRNNLHHQILVNWEINNFAISSENKLAFTVRQLGWKSDLFILDYPFTENCPYKIGTIASPWLIWSPDGQYLAFISIDGRLSIWNHENYFPIHEGRGIHLDWSQDNKLAFVGSEYFVQDVYMWDGRKTINVSQNSKRLDEYPKWNHNGELAFLSSLDDNFEIFIWDGKSKISGIPDPNSFSKVSSPYLYLRSLPVWTNKGTLTLSGISPEISGAQIFEWDGQNLVNISQNPGQSNSGQRWAPTGNWAFTTFDSSEQLLYIRDKDNKPILTTEGIYPPAWGESGSLLFCSFEDLYTGWILKIWNSNELIEIADGDFFHALWSNGNVVFCASG